MLKLKFKVHNVSDVDDDTVRGVYLVPDYDDSDTRAVLGVSKEQLKAARGGAADPSKLLLNEVNGDVHVSELIKGREVTLTLEWGEVPPPPPAPKEPKAKKKAKA